MFKKIIAIIILCVFVFVPLATMIYAVTQIGHDCIGELCSICPSILTKQSLINNSNCFLILIAADIIAQSIQFIASEKDSINLIESKIRMNN